MSLKFISEFSNTIASKKSQTFQNWAILLRDFKVINDKYKKLNKEQSLTFNVLDFFNIGETMHSILLAFILNPNANHGQEDLFLKLFLEKIGIIDPQKGIWYVSAETGRIDLSIVRKDPLSVIIIENKSHHAVDQPNQLYRNWEKAMINPLVEKGKSLNEAIELSRNESYFQILYLAPNINKNPSANSVSRPDESGWEDYPKKIEKHIKHITFKNDISEWLLQSKGLLDNKNNRLKEFLNQYIELIKKL